MGELKNLQLDVPYESQLLISNFETPLLSFTKEMFKLWSVVQSLVQRRSAIP